ncbi:hypothetical protein RRG08_050610 [Elysia crispata]|uniref:Uncharacterized protein n=1 Tax=Elysia crispata TaxID=231223 RepID=A0AAE1E2K9_9GAST|nr:hypothetical protein RRG08_050610 [Elysia crispata]
MPWTGKAGAASSRLVLVQRPGPAKLAQQARDWCSCSRDSTHHRGSETACHTPESSHFRFNYHYPLVPYLQTTLQDLDWTCLSSPDTQSPFINLE